MDNTNVYNNDRERIKSIRLLHPNAYALSANEAILLERINRLVYDFFTVHREFTQVEPPDEKHLLSRVHNVFNQKSVSLLKDTLKTKRISLNKIHKVADRVLSGKWFEVYAAYDLPEVGKDYDHSAYKHLTYITSDKPLTVAERGKFPGLYEVWDNYIKSESKDRLFDTVVTNYDHDPEALRSALNLSEDYLYLCGGERGTLLLIKRIAEFDSIPFTTAENMTLPIKSTAKTSGLAAVGRKSIIEALNVYDELNNAYTIKPTSKINITVYDTELKPNSQMWVNMNKLLTHIQYKLVQSNYADKVVSIGLDEFMDLRGVTDKKEARDSLNEAILNLYHTSIGTDKDDRAVRIIQERSKVIKGRAEIVLSDRFYEELRKNKSLEYFPLSFMRLNGNAFRLAINLFNHRRRNLGTDTENRIGIRKLLEYTTLPIESEIERWRRKDQIITPFINAMIAAAESGEFTYKIVHSKGIELSDHNKWLASYDYDEFINCLIEVQWKNEHEYITQLREDKKQKMIEAKAKDKADQAKPKRKDRAE